MYIPLDTKLISKETMENAEARPTFGSILESTKPKLVAVYYSMHDCPPCREFTPVLSVLYDEINEDEKKLEVIFFSGDKTDEEFNKYYGEMPWLALPRDEKKIMMENAKRF